jgi:hypothetical protein
MSIEAEYKSVPTTVIKPKLVTKETLYEPSGFNVLPQPLTFNRSLFGKDSTTMYRKASKVASGNQDAKVWETVWVTGAVLVNCAAPELETTAPAFVNLVSLVKTTTAQIKPKIPRNKTRIVITPINKNKRKRLMLFLLSIHISTWKRMKKCKF